MPSDLRDVGVVLHLGHGGDPCPVYKGKKVEEDDDDVMMDVDDDEREWNDIISIVHSTGIY
jgi:hypothetical protein